VPWDYVAREWLQVRRQPVRPLWNNWHLLSFIVLRLAELEYGEQVRDRDPQRRVREVPAGADATPETEDKA